MLRVGRTRLAAHIPSLAEWVTTSSCQLPAPFVSPTDLHFRLFSQHVQGGVDHWLDRFTGVRDWLEDANRRWWLRGLVQARCKQHHQLEGREAVIRDAVQAEFSRLMDRHRGLVVDSRSRVHCQVACLALATHKALLLPYLRDEELVLDIIKEHMGSHTDPALM